MEENNKVSVAKIISKYNLQLLNGESIDKFANIFKPSIYRLGLELAGEIIISSPIHNIVGWGTSEYIWFKSLKIEVLEKKLRNIFVWKPPLILLSVGFKDDIIEIILRLASEYKIPIVKSNDHLSHSISIISTYLVEKFSQRESVHASSIIVNGVGVMVIGKSGVGKSEAILELVQKGYIFVSDDTVNISRLGNHFIGRPAPITRNLLEVRGIGLLDIKHTYGSALTKSKLYIDLVVELIIPDKNIQFDRLGNADLEYHILGGSIKKVQIPVQHGRNTSSLIEAAVNWFITQKDNVDPLKIIEERSLLPEK